MIGFFAFLIWELTEKNPIVDLRVFRHRGLSASMLVLALAFGAFFGLAGQAGRELLNGLTTSQSLLLATNDLMIVIAIIFFISAFAIALAPEAARSVDAAAIGH